MSSAVSLCVLRIEINHDDDGEASAIALDVNETSVLRSQREFRDIKIETFPSKLEATRSDWGFLPQDQRESGAMSHSDDDIVGDGQEISFFSGNPFVEVTKGMLHLYKEDVMTTTSDALTLCLIGVPASMNCNDLLTYIAPCHAEIAHVRIIRDSTPNQFMAVLTFRSNEAARDFYVSYNGAPFNSLEPDYVCRAVWISKVEWATDGNPPLGHTELPICPVCLERMDESVDGVLTIFCNHSFHSSCLLKWSDSTCPVCRCVQSPEVAETSECMQCGRQSICSNSGIIPPTEASRDSLWICLICGHIGCGRYQGGHAAMHYRASGHCYALQLGSNRVWDYKGDNFVHRLLQNKSDGKLVASPQPPTVPSENMVAEEKIDSVQLEFTYLLTSQLDAQRQYFEDRLARLESGTFAETDLLRQKINQATQATASLETKLSNVVKEKNALEKKINQLTTRLSTAQSELVEERQLGKALRNNQQQWQAKLAASEEKYKQYKAAKDVEISDLKEQLRDLMFYINAEQAIEKSENKDEIASGTVVVGESAKPKTKNRRKR